MRGLREQKINNSGERVRGSKFDGDEVVQVLILAGGMPEFWLWRRDSRAPNGRRDARVLALEEEIQSPKMARGMPGF